VVKARLGGYQDGGGTDRRISAAAGHTFGVMPPEDHSYPGTTPVPYNEFNCNVYGTSYYAQVTYQFDK